MRFGIPFFSILFFFSVAAAAVEDSLRVMVALGGSEDDRFMDDVEIVSIGSSGRFRILDNADLNFEPIEQ